LTWTKRSAGWSDSEAYADSKLHNILLANSVAAAWPDVTSSSLDPGWVPTKMGGSGASGDIEAAVKTYVALAEGSIPNASGKYFFSSTERSPKADATNKATQDKYMKICEEVTGVVFPK
jgi:NAD(P)-dependent dehydrogenase (short-subunit alcohol dehydrogenase family)